MNKVSFPAVDLNRLLSTSQLPAMPQSAARLLALSRDPMSGPNEYAIPIEADPGLTTQVLRYVNSSYFGFRCKINSIRQAITLVGVRTVKNFCLYTAVFSLIPNPKCGQFDLKSLWQDSLRRGLFARSLGKTLGLVDPEAPFAAALLQDMAVPLLAREVPDAYSTFLAARAKSDAQVRLSRLEQHVFGWTHAEAAGIMARQWHLPDEFASLVESHLSVEDWATHPQGHLDRLSVAMSAMLPTTADRGWTEFGQFDSYYDRIRTASSPGLESLLTQIDQEFAELAPVLNIPLPAVPLAENYRRAVEPIQIAMPAGT